MVEETGELHPAAVDARRGGRVAELAGVTGRLGVEVDGKPIGELVVDDGNVQLVGEAAPTAAVIAFRSAEDLWKILRGELNPVVAALQGKLSFRGDLTFGVKVALAIAADSPFPASRAKGA